MNNIIHRIQHTARATAVLLIALCAAQTAWAQWSGSGTSADPYKITSADDLAQLATNVNNGTDGLHRHVLQADCEHHAR